MTETSERQRVWKTPPGVTLCAETDIADPGSRGFVLQIGEAFFHGFVVRKDGQVAGWVDRWPDVSGSSLPSASAGVSGSTPLIRASSSSLGRSAIATVAVTRRPLRMISSGIRDPNGCCATRQASDCSGVTGCPATEMTTSPC